MPVRYARTIVCLANSRKPQGRCVAGRELRNGVLLDWIRPVSGRPACELSKADRRYGDGQDPQILDIIDIAMSSPSARLHQAENHIIDARYRWRRRGVFPRERIGELLDSPETLWPDGQHTYHGENDAVGADRIAEVHNSLYLIRPDSPTIIVSTDDGPTGVPRRRVRIRFAYNRSCYKLLVTDPAIESKLLQQPDDAYDMHNVCLCVSLTEPFGEYRRCFKIVATILGEKDDKV